MSRPTQSVAFGPVSGPAQTGIQTHSQGAKRAGAHLQRLERHLVALGELDLKVTQVDDIEVLHACTHTCTGQEDDRQRRQQLTPSVANPLAPAACVQQPARPCGLLLAPCLTSCNTLELGQPPVQRCLAALESRARAAA